MKTLYKCNCVPFMNLPYFSITVQNLNRYIFARFYPLHFVLRKSLEHHMNKRGRLIMKHYSKVFFIFTITCFVLCAAGCHTSEKTSTTTPSLKANVCTENVSGQSLASTGTVMTVSEGSASTGAVMTVSEGSASTGAMLTVSPAAAAKKEPVLLETGRIYEINPEAQFSLSKITTGKTVWASLGADYYYENPKEGQVYIDLVLNFTNNSKKELPVSKICSLSAKTKKGKRYRCSWFTTEIEKGTRLSSQVSIASGETAKLHCTLSVPDKKETFLLSLKFEDTFYEMEYKLGQEITPAVSIDSSSQNLAEFEPAVSLFSNKPPKKKASAKKKQTKNRSLLITKDSFGSFRMTDLFYTRNLKPEKNEKGVYYHIKEEDKNKTFLVAKLKVTNEGRRAKPASSFINASVCYKKNFRYSYRGFALSENLDKKGFEAQDLAPSEKRTVYVIMEVPVKLIKQPKEITFYFAGSEYVF